MFESYKEIVYKKENEIEYIQFKKLLEFGIKHAYTLKGENINFRSDNPFEKESYKKLFNALNLDEKNMVKPYQRHTSNIRCINKVLAKSELNNVDGLITDRENIVLSTTNADCILLMFYDPVKKVIANIHSGWRGTAQKIGEKAIIKMVNYYKCNPKDIYVFICPSIRKCHFEVDSDVKDLFESIFSFTNKTDEFIKKGDIKEGKQKYNIDTIKINKYLLIENGIIEENIIDSGICSVCENEKISSYRADGASYKLATAIISL